jgi:hypothetical protein
MGATQRNSRSPGRLHQQSGWQPHCRPTPAASATVVSRAVRTYKPMSARSTRRMPLSLGSLPVRKVAAAALGVAAPDEDDATIDNATAVGAPDLHAAHLARSGAFLSRRTSYCPRW